MGGDDVQGNFERRQPEEEEPSRREEVSTMNQDGYEVAKGLRY